MNESPFDKLKKKIKDYTDFTEELLIPNEYILNSTPKPLTRGKFKAMYELEKPYEGKAEELKAFVEKYKNEQIKLLEKENTESLEEVKINTEEMVKILKNYSEKLKSRVNEIDKQSIIRFDHFIEEYKKTILDNIEQIIYHKEINEFLRELREREKESDEKMFV